MSKRAVPTLRWTLRVVALGVVVLVVATAARKLLDARRTAQLQAQTQRLRGMFFTGNYEGASLEGERLVKRFPESSELKAWYVLSHPPAMMPDVSTRLA